MTWLVKYLEKRIQPFSQLHYETRKCKNISHQIQFEGPTPQGRLWNVTWPCPIHYFENFENLCFMWSAIVKNGNKNNLLPNNTLCLFNEYFFKRNKHENRVLDCLFLVRLYAAHEWTIFYGALLFYVRWARECLTWWITQMFWNFMIYDCFFLEILWRGFLDDLLLRWIEWLWMLDWLLVWTWILGLLFLTVQGSRVT